MQLEGSISVPSLLSEFTQSVFDEYPLYQFNIPSKLINSYLPNKLNDFPSMTLKNLAKHYCIYSRSAIFASHAQLSEIIEWLPRSLSLTDVLEELLTGNNLTIRYNFVILGNSLIFVRIPRLRHIPYYIHCKHIVLSNRSTDVRFAGELWCDEDNCFRLNNNSGTYRPSDILIDDTVELFNLLTPSLQFKGSHFEKKNQPSVKHRIVTNIINNYLT